ncbi:hypothetical protein [Actinocrinis sp.]|uniref:FDXHR family putative zinc-binding protein n=1 Tax=Actinocrinis sp. TaxID=1920516 RepID=UPI002D497043|nr:hypothetical protein [Actinocrinis sp.]HZP49658.1 hypothetical protein [Actinocrinis sp.]
MTETETHAEAGHTHRQPDALSEGRSTATDRPEGDLLQGNGPIPGRPQSPGIPAEAIRHSCGQWWTGTRVAHCGSVNCHRTFSSTTAFDRHQRNKPDGGVECLNPATVGLVPVEKPYGVLWSWPASDRNPHAAKGDDDA